ncbi:HAD-IIIC family phosphatase [Brevibacillus brevis]|uniref:HAD-IIIC family phosphatase n=1 Tax=Brevibacillus brevis TaxID=1393 RepID=UPI00165D3D10|nr:HAD-IIIC family phosphatase [Brevibacillus brevis]
MPDVKALILADTIVDPILRFLSDRSTTPFIEAKTGPYNQVQQILMDPHHSVWKEENELLIVWTTPERSIPSFEKVLGYEEFEINSLMDEVDYFASNIIESSQRSKLTFVVSWSMPPHYREIQTLAFKHNVGHTNILMQMNLRLAQHFSNYNHIVLLDSNYWYNSLQKKSFDHKMFALGKINYSRDYFEKAAYEMKSVIRAFQGKTKKVVICDLDNTLWGGIIGDDGIDNINLGGINPIGESFIQFQKELKKLRERGILLAISSKNDESIAKEMIENHPEMILRMSDFSAYRINWKDKAENIAEMVNELNIGLQSVVFLDDNPTERERVKQAFPEIYTPDLPEDYTAYPTFIRMLDCFETIEITREDRVRTEMYQKESERKISLSNASSIDDWLKSLDISVKVLPLEKNLLTRAVQLLNKTNQFNMATNRYTEDEYWNWSSFNQNQVYVFQVQDKFGDSGITALISFSVSNNQAEIVDFVMSCRVMGKKIEEALLFNVMSKIKKMNIDSVRARYQKTDKNQPFFDFIKDKYTDSSNYLLDINKVLSPDFINVINEVQN